MDRLLLTPEQAAEALAVSRWRLFALLRSRELGSVKIGASRRIPVEALRAYIAALGDGGAA